MVRAPAFCKGLAQGPIFNWMLFVSRQLGKDVEMLSSSFFQDVEWDTIPSFILLFSVAIIIVEYNLDCTDTGTIKYIELLRAGG